MMSGPALLETRGARPSEPGADDGDMQRYFVSDDGANVSAVPFMQ